MTNEDDRPREDVDDELDAAVRLVQRVLGVVVVWTGRRGEYLLDPHIDTG